MAFSVRWTLSLGGGVETGSTGHCGRPPLLVQVWPPSGSRPEMQFLLHLVCALLTDVNQTQPKLTSLWIITHHSQQRWQPIAFFDAALVCLLDIDSINPRNKNPDVLRPSKTLITENRNYFVREWAVWSSTTYPLASAVRRPSSRCLVCRRRAAPCIFTGALHPLALEI